MNIFKFIAWQWNRFDVSEKGFFISLAASIGALILQIFVYSHPIWALVIGFIVSFIIAAIICIICVAIRQQWRKFIKAQEEEAERIVRKLRGSN